jgi:hypothetical protein
MRNQAQWVLWVADDFALARMTRRCWGRPERLKENAPLAHDRAERLITALGRQPHYRVSSAGRTWRGGGAGGTTCRRRAGDRGSGHGMGRERSAGTRAGQPVQQPRRGLAGQADGGGDDAVVDLGATGKPMAQMEFFSPWPSGMPQLSPERVFEPFASGRPSGLGLGLYQARKSLREAGGDLYATPSPEGLGFRLMLPVPSP